MQFNPYITATLIALIGFVSQGCVASRKGEQSRDIYFGLVMVKHPQRFPDENLFEVQEVKTIGFGAIKRGILIGYCRTKHIQLPPDSAIYLEVKTNEQFKEAKKLIEQLEKTKLCISKNMD